MFCKRRTLVDFFILVDPLICSRGKEFGKMTVKRNMGSQKREELKKIDEELLQKMKEISTKTQILTEKYILKKGGLFEWGLRDTLS